MELKTGAKLRSFSCDFLRALALTPNGNEFLGGSLDGRVDVWDLKSGGELRRFAHHGPLKGERLSESEYTARSLLKTGLWLGVKGEAVRSVAAIAEGRDDDVARSFRRAQREPDPIQDGINAITFDRNGQCVYTASEDGSVGIWAWPSGEPIRALQGHAGAVSDVTCVPASELIATASVDGTVRVWNRETGLEDVTLIGRGRAIEALSASIDGRWIAASNRRGR